MNSGSPDPVVESHSVWAAARVELGGTIPVPADQDSNIRNAVSKKVDNPPFMVNFQVDQTGRCYKQKHASCGLYFSRFPILLSFKYLYVTKW
jgi:hypothetical protein